ncbi:hypothetical protein Rhopal_000135-T1 [Rhodotorula paludigena]|uniref:Uncharacterized protein n=1 Tax=Rhodotorula paludigena TaxID=86838 RepID=A0AAV5GBP8_9BASI|nr:hypothetical protein Rhopal_000135-T1 [Rhodotorula paludigena]
MRKRATVRPVFAHVVQGNWQAYSQEDYAAEYARAREAGIDAFALNVGHDASDPEQMQKAFAAAEEGGFKLFWSFDMNYFSGPGASEVMLDEYLGKWGGSSAYYTWEDKLLVSTFSGEVPGTFLDGASSFKESNAKWSALLDAVKDKLGGENIWAGGIFSWAAWGDKGRIDEMTTKEDQTYVAAAGKAGLAYMAPVAAFFYVHVAADNNYVLQSGGHLLAKHYSDLIALNPGPDFIELLSINDYGESHYLSSVSKNAGVPEGAKGYVDSSRDHTPMLWLSAYYNVYSDALSRPDNADTLQDVIEAAVFVPEGSKAAQLIFTTGGQALEAQAVKAGVNLLSASFVPGSVAIALQDANGNQLLSGTGEDIVDGPATYDFNFRTYILPDGATAS